MSFIEQLKQRSGNTCEICQSSDQNSVYRVPPSRIDSVDTSLIVCNPCKSQIEKESPMSADHWRCLNDSIWSEHDAVKVVSWRMLQRLRNEGWPQDLIDMLYLTPDLETFARASGDHLEEKDLIIHRDSNGVTARKRGSSCFDKGFKCQRRRIYRQKRNGSQTHQSSS